MGFNETRRRQRLALWPRQHTPRKIGSHAILVAVRDARGTPACSLCEKRNNVCVYDSTFDQRSFQARAEGLWAALETRVVLLEGILRDARTKDVASHSGLASTQEGGTSQAVLATTAPPPIAFTPLGPSLEPGQGLEPELEFVPSDDAARALVSIVHLDLGKTAATTSIEFDLGMGGYVPLVSLDMEHQLLARFWDWQRGNLPYVAPVPFLSAYALYAQVAHPDEQTPPPSLSPPNPLTGPSATDVPSPESVDATPELAQFISPLLLDAMFVIGALFHGDAEMSAQFYKRAESRMMSEAANPRLATAQGVMLMATTEFGHARAPIAWTLNGIVAALCVRLGMHGDATLLVRDGSMSKVLFETRNLVLWTTYHNDRFYAVCLGMRPLLDRHSISTPRHSSLAAANAVKLVYPELGASVAGLSSAPAEKSAVLDAGTVWRSPTALELADAFVQAGWEAMHDLAQITDMLFNEIYALDAPKRTPQEELELVARNNLTIQRFLDDRHTTFSTLACILKLHSSSAIHISNILMCWPFLSPRPLSEDAMRLDATAEISQPTHSSHIIRRYRTLAFRIARASALQIISLVRYIPLSSPCTTTPYLIYTACTILLLAPGDTTAMGGVRMGMACLKNIQDTGHWATSMKDGREGVLELANRWGVDIELGKKLLRLALRGHRGSGGGREEHGVGEANGDNCTSDSNAGPTVAQSSDIGGGAQRLSGSSSGARPDSAAENGTESTSVTRPSAGAVTLNETAEPGVMRGHRHPGSTQEHQYDHPTRMYAGPEYSEGVASASNYGHTDLLPQGDYGAAVSDARCTAVAQNYRVWEYTGNQYPHASGPVHTDESANGPTHTPQQQYHSPTPVRFDARSHGIQSHDFSQTDLGVMSYEREIRLSSVARQRVYLQQLQRQQQYRQPSSKLRQQSHYPPHFQHPSQIFQAHSPIRHHHKPTSPASLPDITYALSRPEPQHYSHPPQTHWHQILPPADPNLPFPSDLAACTDLAAYFADTIRTAQDPAFARSVEDPYAGMTLDWVSDVECSFPAVTLDAFTSLDGAGSGTGMSLMEMGMVGGMSTSGGVVGIYAQDNEAGRSYGHGHPAYVYDGAGYMGEYGSQGI
ncbi:hypothetical protein BDV93DRAFT_586800 [Ceratobasidium sp. AG-I]|nr:hypothetical protein BDV93DRAFT_586800 [Ceratobasidium sp. AG-I]